MPAPATQERAPAARDVPAYRPVRPAPRPAVGPRGAVAGQPGTTPRWASA